MAARASRGDRSKGLCVWLEDRRPVTTESQSARASSPQSRQPYRSTAIILVSLRTNVWPSWSRKAKQLEAGEDEWTAGIETSAKAVSSSSNRRTSGRAMGWVTVPWFDTFWHRRHACGPTGWTGAGGRDSRAATPWWGHRATWCRTQTSGYRPAGCRRAAGRAAT